jgi:hypothetical protein
MRDSPRASEKAFGSGTARQWIFMEIKMTNAPSKSTTIGLSMGAACIALLFGTAVAAADSVIITKEQAPEVQQYIVKQHVEPVTPSDNFDVQVGTVVPETVEIHQLDVPSLPKEYDYMVVNGQTVIVDPQTRKIVQVLH